MRQEADSNEIVPNELTDRRQLLYGTVSIWNVQAYPPPPLPPVGWRKKRFFIDFRKWHYAADPVYFEESISKTLVNFAARSPAFSVSLHF